MYVCMYACMSIVCVYVMNARRAYANMFSL